MMLTAPAAAPLTDAEIIAHYQARTLLAKLQRPLNTTQQEALCVQLAALHNAGNIDMLALTAAPEFLNLDRQHFFTVQQIYSGVIPRLEAPSLAMLEMAGRLVTKGGNDGLATIPRDALRRWIGQDPSRAHGIITAAQSDPGIDREVLREALVTLADLSLVKSFLAVADQRRQAAIAALGGIKPQNLQAGDEGFTELVAIAATDPVEDMRFTAIFAAFGLLQHCEAHASQWVPRLVAAVRAAPSEETRTALLQGLWRQSGSFQAADVKATLALVSDADLSPALRGMLDGTLSHLLAGPHHDLAIDCLTNLLASDGWAVSLEDFPGLEHRLMNLDSTQLFGLAVRWFATGDRKLCESMTRLIGPVHQPQPFDTTLAGWGLSGSQMIVTCHKAIGYLILAPVVAASFVVAALRAGDKTAEAELVQLLVQSILINYGEMAAAYLRGVPKGDKAYRPVRRALKLYRAYEEDLNIKTPIKELFPSSSQRGAVRQRHYLTQREIRKEAERQSVFHGLMQRSTLLYGRKAIAYVRGADEPPVSMEMKTIRAGFEMPRLQIVDPVGLDWLIRIFRVSKPK
jgi:hypothetical protein